LIPVTWMSLRLACAWPILIGVETVARLHTVNVLDSQQRVKISRSEVRNVIARSVLCYPFPGRWRRLFPLPGEA